MVLRVLVVGATGLLGSEVKQTLLQRGHDVVGASRHGEVRVDIRDSASIASMYQSVGLVDAVAVTAGYSLQKSLADASREDFETSIQDKLIGQMELVRQGVPFVGNVGSFTLVSGITSRVPIKSGSILSTVNAAIDGFVIGAAVDLPGSLRINSVSANVFEEALPVYDKDFPGFSAVSTRQVAQAYVQSIEGVQTGRTFRVGY